MFDVSPDRSLNSYLVECWMHFLAFRKGFRRRKDRDGKILRQLLSVEGIMPVLRAHWETKWHEFQLAKAKKDNRDLKNKVKLWVDKFQQEVLVEETEQSEDDALEKIDLWAMVNNGG